MKYNIEKKLIGYSADNTNTNFGGVKRTGEENVFHKLKQYSNSNLIGIGCPVHIVHNSSEKGINSLLFDIEAIAYKIHQHFSIYTARVESLKDFCEFVNVQYKEVLSYGKTRFLSLFPVIDRILQLFPALKSYFLSLENCPRLLKDFYESNLSEMYCWFVHSIMYVFHDKTKILETEKNTIIDTIQTIESLKQIIRSRIHESFIPLQIKSMITVLTREGFSKSVQDFKNNMVHCYKISLDYLELWTNQLETFNIFTWMAINDEETVIWDRVQQSIQFINEQMNEQVIDDVKAFDQYCNLKVFLKNNINNEQFQNNSINKKWLMYFENNKSDVFNSELLKICQFVFAIPSQNVNVERIFSMVDIHWSKERNRLQVKTVEAILTVAYNYKDMECRSFYEKIKDDKNFLKDISSSEKYNNE